MGDQAVLDCFVNFHENVPNNVEELITGTRSSYFSLTIHLNRDKVSF